MPRYLLLIWGDEEAWAAMPPEEQMREFQAYTEYTQWLRDRGWYRAADALKPGSTATQVRVREGRTLSTDGPFAETKEQLAGYYQVDCADLDDAIEAASRIPAARGGVIEVRPILETDQPQP